MKVAISERQYNLISNFVIEQDSSTSTEIDPTPKTGESENKPEGKGYPKVTKWEDIVGAKLTRGPANQIKNTKWSDIVGATLKRDAANQLSEQSITGQNPLTNPLHDPKIMRDAMRKVTLDDFQKGMDFAGLIPFVGDVLDLINGMIYLGRSIYEKKFYPYVVDACLSFIGIIPYVGSAISIPVKSAFKTIGVKNVEKVISTITKGGGASAAKLLSDLLEKLGAKDYLKQIADIIRPKIGNANNFFDVLSDIRKYLKKLPRLIRNNPLINLAVESMEMTGRGLKGFFNTILDIVDGKIVSLFIKEVPSNLLTASRRIKPQNFKFFTQPLQSTIQKLTKFNVRNSEKLFLAMQDFFADYLGKEGEHLVTKDIANQAAKNLNIKIYKDVRKTIESSPKLQREITNLVILNNPKSFENFIASSSITTRFNLWAKSITDPTIYKETTTLFKAVVHFVKKIPLVYTKRNTETDAEIEKRLNPKGKTNNSTSTKTNNGNQYSPIVYKNVVNTPFHVGDRNGMIGHIQRCLGLPKTSEFDPGLEKVLKDKGYNMSGGITWEMYKKIMAYCKK